MASLSFVALSMQTTHLDPATVSQAAYLKMVDGQVTRLDTISIIPPTSESGTDGPVGAVPWSEALAQLGMVIGKLPIVSYYRDADKEIFQAASRRSGTELPNFQWLDCRALARELLPELPDHQPSTVLQALDLYDKHADSGTVEQTAQIVLKLAERQAATTLSELWGELYDQPDDLLDLETTLNGGVSSEMPSPTEDADNYPGIIDPSLPQTVGVADQSLDSQSQDPEDTGVQRTDELTAETGSAPEHTAGREFTSEDIPNSAGLSPEESSESADTPPHRDDEDTADVDAGNEEIEDLGDSTAQSVIASENLDQPAFLKIPDHAGPQDDGMAELHTNATPPEIEPEASDDDKHLDDPDHAMEDVAEGLNNGHPSDSQVPELQADQLPLPVGDEPATAEKTPSPDVDAAMEGATGEEPAETESSEVAEPSAPQPASATKPSDPAYQVVTPAPVPRPGSTGSTSSTTTELLEANTRRNPPQASRQPSARTGRLWGILGLIVFGLLTIVGVVLTVMAGVLFFTANNLLLETKVAGVVLTGAITLLSLLMATLSYRAYRRK